MTVIRTDVRLLSASALAVDAQGRAIAVTTVSQGLRGMPGIPGAQGPAGGDVAYLVAEQALGGHRAVVSVGAQGAGYADAYDPLHVGRVVGITTAAASQGAEVPVQSHGAIEEISWSWVPEEDIFLGADGLLTQALPLDAAFAQRLGQALTPTRMRVDISEPVLF